MTGEGKLTPKQQRFVEEYSVDCNATQAAVRAGYSQKNADKIGPELLGKTRVKEAIAKKQKSLSVKAEYDALAWFKDMLNLKKVLSQTVILGESDDGAVESFPDASSLLKCMDMLAKHLGAYNKDESEKDGIELLADVMMKKRGQK